MASLSRAGRPSTKFCMCWAMGPVMLVTAQGRMVIDISHLSIPGIPPVSEGMGPMAMIKGVRACEQTDWSDLEWTIKSQKERNARV